MILIQARWSYIGNVDGCVAREHIEPFVPLDRFHSLLLDGFCNENNSFITVQCTLS